MTSAPVGTRRSSNVPSTRLNAASDSADNSGIGCSDSGKSSNPSVACSARAIAVATASDGPASLTSGTGTGSESAGSAIRAATLPSSSLSLPYVTTSVNAPRT